VTAMTTTPDRERVEADPPALFPRHEPGVRWDRVAFGLLLAAAGVGWLLDSQGASVPWHLAPAAGVAVVGAVLLVSLVGGRGRTNVATLGVVLLVAAIAVGVGAGRFTGPVGDRTITPGTDDWSGTTISAGTLTVDLTHGPLPATGRLDVAVGAGRVVLRLPADRPIEVRAAVVAGTVRVDDVAVQEGVDLNWTDPAIGDAPLTVVVDVGAGDVEVSRATY